MLTLCGMQYDINQEKINKEGVNPVSTGNPVIFINCNLLAT